MAKSPPPINEPIANAAKNVLLRFFRIEFFPSRDQLLGVTVVDSL